MPKKPSIRGYLIHITHYDPRWIKKKSREKPFNLKVGLEVVEALAEQGFNLLSIATSDGVKYRSHPEYAKHYSVPMDTLRKLAARARKLGLDVVPKLNFSRSEINQHNHWMRTKDIEWHQEFDDAVYWKKAFEVIDEVIAACKPKRYIHIGMDEDHQRSHAQYAAAIETLRDGLKKRKLRTVIWNDSGIGRGAGDHHVEKSIDAERRISADVIHILWNYNSVPKTAIRRIVKRFDLWGAPGYRDPDQTRAYRDAILKAGGRGLFMTNWVPCQPVNRKLLLGAIATMGPIYRGV